ncbi:RBBP9/YdeN family alpha/beta hydrolase [Rhodovulum strictum]|uniref:Alpha/beta hydrolase n=1 Tax=Rhodovulum strictum TaxID=58314 RepID=A0A844BIN3_9RHOB|nr:alpha/beta hydrolase [Rhodovulum strictum]MRH21385.1 alpha/beta hydrolase [Rhodovulum strictum]
MTRTLIVPGVDGSPAAHWQSWWLGVEPSSRLVDQANWSKPQPDDWETEIAGAILHYPDSILVGHSLGAITIARVLTRWPHLKVRAAMLVAPAEPRREGRLAAFAPIPERPLRVPTLVVASRNDPWMTFTRASHLAGAWGAALYDMGFAGHVNVESGFGPWPRGLELRDELLQTATFAPPAIRLPRGRSIGRSVR